MKHLLGKLTYVIASGALALLAASQACADAPRIVSASVIGVHPGTPFLHLVGVASRSDDLRFSASGLPPGLHLDPRTGIISGGAPAQAGTYNVSLRVSGRDGSHRAWLRIEVGAALALTPPMGWNSWNSFEGAISEAVVYEIADALERTGLRDAGYVYVNLDDHWADINRKLVVYRNNVSAEWRLQASLSRFPNGLTPVAAALHARGFKLGVYSDAGVTTCAEAQPGSYGFEEVDARTFAEWGVDYLKYDYCYAPEARDVAVDRYTRMGRALEASGRSIVYSICEWGVRAPWEWARAAGGHLWRTTGDMRDHWEFSPGRAPSRNTAIGVLDAADLQVGLKAFQAPGGWNDPDMLVMGVDLANSAAHRGAQGIGEIEERSMMSLWALMGAPLIVNADVRKLDPQSPHFDRTTAARLLPLLINREVIAVNQDELGLQGVRVAEQGDGDVWAKRLSNGTVAVGLLNRGDAPMEIAARWSDLGLHGRQRVRDLWARRDLGVADASWSAIVAAHELVLITLSPQRRR
jgi:alpha-galactosidase